MSAGVVPLVHNWLGANNIYPTNFLFNTAEECLGIVKRVDSDHSAISGLREELRKYITETFDIELQAKNILEMLKSL